MGHEFQAEPGPADELCGRIAALSPTNPFYTPSFVAARCRAGTKSWVLCMRNGSDIVTGCTAFMTSGRLRRTLEIQSVPTVRDDGFWRGIESFCREKKITHLIVNSFGSREGFIPRLATETSRKARREYLLYLAGDTLLRKLSSNHKRNIAHAKKAGLVMRVRSDSEACTQHAVLINASMSRRQSRGEAVSGFSEAPAIRRYVETGAGAIYQAVRGSTVLSSILVLFAQRGAYYHSAGTSPEGMELGASHFLVYHIAESMAQQGYEVFNLGGADENGLARFKTGFGAVVVEVEAAHFFFGSPLRGRLINAVCLLQQPIDLLRQLGWDIESYIAYSCAPEAICRSQLPPGVRAEKLDDRTLRGIATEYQEMSIHARVLDRMGHNDAFGFYVDGQLAHVIWLVPPEHDRHHPVRNVKLRAGEAEITHAVTLQRFRGRALYACAIQYLAYVARDQGVRRIYMITGTQNVASQRGIEKAGLARAGRIIRVGFRYLRDASITFRGHRFGFRKWGLNGVAMACSTDSAGRVLKRTLQEKRHER